MTEPHAVALGGIAAEGDSDRGKTWPGDDFPAWLPPMLVRELRQGIQSGAFFWTFLLTQAVLFVLAAYTLFAATDTFASYAKTSRVAGLIWVPLGITLGLVIPLRGMTAIASEQAANNLDLIRMTRLSATRIVVGKWAAILAQAVLIAVAALPYLVLPYFYGGVNVVGDLTRFIWMLMVSGLVAAFAVFASTRPQRERVGLLVLVGIGAWVTLVSSFTPMSPGPVFAAGWLWLIVPIFYAAVLLEAAAASIAPPAENHALRKRLFGLFCAGIITVTALFGSANQCGATLVVMGLPLLVIGVATLLERPVRIRRMHAVFASGGFVGKALASVFTPGWATGVVYIALVGGMTVGAILAQREAAGTLQAALPFVTLSVAAILFPLPLLLLFPKLEARGTFYVMVQVLNLVPWVFEVVLSEMRAPGSLGLVVAFPLAGLLRLLGPVDPSAQQTLFIAGFVITAGVIAMIARPWRRAMRETWRLVDGELPA